MEKCAYCFNTDVIQLYILCVIFTCIVFSLCTISYVFMLMFIYVYIYIYMFMFVLYVYMVNILYVCIVLILNILL